MKEVIHRIVDDGDFFEVQEHCARNIIVGFARLNGRSVGIVAKQPSVLAGVLDIDSATRPRASCASATASTSRSSPSRTCPASCPASSQEHGGIIRHGAKLLYAYCEATVPKLTVITRKAYGGAYDVMSSKHMRGDLNYAWPTAEIAVMGAEGAVNIIFKDEIARPPDPMPRSARNWSPTIRRSSPTPTIAAARGYVDEMIEPRDTRAKLIRALEMLKNKRDTNPPKKHGNIPL